LEILNGLIQFTLFIMGKFNSKVEPPLETDYVRLSRVHCTHEQKIGFQIIRQFQCIFTCYVVGLKL